MKSKPAHRGTKSQYTLANQILDIVRDRRLERGAKITEMALAEQLGVSRTPVRAALALLAREGVAVARVNQGFTLLKGWADLKSMMLTAPAGTEADIYAKLISERLAGNIPAVVTQNELLDHFNANRAMLMNVLALMAGEGLVTKNKGHGWTFAPSINSIQSLHNSYDFRLAIEPSIFLLDTYKIDLQALDRTRSRHLGLLEQGDRSGMIGKQLFEIDAQFHETLASFGENSFFLQAIKDQNRLRRLHEYQGYGNLGRIRDWVREHLEILDALWNNDREAASERMRVHLKNARLSALNTERPSRAIKARKTTRKKNA
jgi:DNA-binding GntR family transcriptional regulator